MKQLKFKFDLSSRVAIYVPGTIDVNKEIDTSEFVTLVMSKFSEWFGGATASDARGGWVSPAAGLVIEKVTIIYAFCKEFDLQNRFEDKLKHSVINIFKIHCYRSNSFKNRSSTLARFRISTTSTPMMPPTTAEGV